MRVLLPFVLLAFAVGCSQPDRAREAPAPARQVTIERAALQSLPQVIEAGGVVQARTTAVITSRIVSPVLSVLVLPGDRVRAGQPLVRLDARDLDAQRERAAAAAGALALGAQAIAAEREGAEAALVLARATHARIAALHERRSATPHELDEAVSALRSAEARLRAIEARVSESQSGLESARAAAHAATVIATYAVITAPFDGIVTEKLVEPGNLATPGMPLLRVEDSRAFRLEVRLDASRAAIAAPGQTVDVALDGRSPDAGFKPVEGRVAEVARAVDAGSQAFVVKIDLPASAAIRSGTFARARFRGRSRDVLTVPAEAVVRQGQLPTVFVVHEARARLRVVHAGETGGSRVEILAGLSPGDEVIVAPPPGLRDGDRVEPAARAAARAGDR